MQYPDGDDVEGWISKGLTEVTPEAVPPEMGGVGKKITLTIALNQEETRLIELFSETTIKGCPGDDDLGFTEDDISVYEGISIITLAERDGEQRRVFAEIIPFEQFLDLYIVNSGLRVLLEMKMDKLTELSKLPDNYLETMSQLWESRDLGVREIQGPTYRC